LLLLAATEKGETLIKKRLTVASIAAAALAVVLASVAFAEPTSTHS
jgi:hypothetical protein